MKVMLVIIISGGVSVGAGGAVLHQEFSENSFLFMKQFIPLTCFVHFA